VYEEVDSLLLKRTYDYYTRKWNPTSEK
jgi:hypothetical protein